VSSIARLLGGSRTTLYKYMPELTEGAKALADFERILGPDHPNTLGSRNNLAGAYASAGRTAEAIPLLEQTLTDAERILGPDHPNTSSSRNNLAHAYESVGRTAEAILLLEQALADRERILGPDHPDTLTSRSNLAQAYESGGPDRRGDPAAGAGSRRP
jgi:tetratricopeptide (TPR) repeat protein